MPSEAGRPQGSSRMFTRLIAYFRGLARRRQISLELEDEMRFHLEQHIEANVRRGMSLAEARRLARLDFGRLAQVTPSLGRIFTNDETEPGHATKALRSFALWQSQFGADPAAVGPDLRIDGQPYTIVGVMPKAFALIASDVSLWTPLTLTPE